MDNSIIWKKVRVVVLAKFGNPGTKEENESYYSLDGKSILYNGYEVKNADFETFAYCFRFAKDKNNCYRTNTKYKEADPETFEVLNYHFAKDKNHIYSVNGIVKNIDYESFEVLDNGYKIDKDGRKVSSLSFSSDKSGVWWMDYYSLKPTLIKGTNKVTFQRIDDAFSKDEKYVYYAGTRLSKANPLTWKRLNEGTYFSQDEDKFYFGQELLKDADPDTFEIVALPEALGIKPYAKDKNLAYICHNIVSHKELEENIKEELKFIEELKKG